MNRFEQKSMSLGRKLIYLLPILAFVILFVLFLRGIGSVSEASSRKVWKPHWNAAFPSAMP